MLLCILSAIFGIAKSSFISVIEEFVSNIFSSIVSGIFGFKFAQEQQQIIIICENLNDINSVQNNSKSSNDSISIEASAEEEAENEDDIKECCLHSQANDGGWEFERENLYQTSCCPMQAA